MASKADLLNHSELKTAVRNDYLWYVTFDTVTGTADPDGVTPDYGGDIAVAHAGTDGDYTITFAGDKKPYLLRAGWCAIQGDQAGFHAKVTGYTESTGVLTVTVYDEDNTSGIQAPANTNDVKVQVFCIFSKVEGV